MEGDWELLHNSDSEPVNSENPIEEIEGDYSESMIRSDYFSIDSEKRYAKTTSVVDVGSVEEGSVESNNPSWIDPGLVTGYQRKNSGEFWSDSGSDRSDERKFGDFEGRNELGFVESGKSEVGFGGVGEREGGGDDLRKFNVKNQLGFEGNGKSQVAFEGIGEIQGQDDDLGRFWSDSGGDGLVPMSFEGVERKNEMSFGDHEQKHEESEICGETDSGNGSVGANSSVAIAEMKGEVKTAGVGEGESRRVAWWKVPFEVLRYCVLKVNPVWSFSVAAAVMGLIILGRRLSKMKRKSKSLQLKVTLDDKKVSQFMSRAARLNEAFSVVRRVPVVRPALPVAGVNPWPVVTLR